MVSARVHEGREEGVGVQQMGKGTHWRERVKTVMAVGPSLPGQLPSARPLSTADSHSRKGPFPTRLSSSLSPSVSAHSTGFKGSEITLSVLDISQ